MSFPIFSFLPFISAVFVLFLGVFVFLKNKNSKLNLIFFLLSVSVTVWLFSTFMMFISKTDSQAIFWDRTVYLGVIFIPILMYHFGLAFSKTRNPKILYLGYFLAVIFVVLSRTNYFVSGLFEYRWGVHSQAQIFHHIFLIYFSIYLFLFYFNIYCYYRKTKINIRRNQAKYIFIAFLILLFGVTGYLPAYGIRIYPFAYLSGLIFTIILAYTILKYRLMDIRVIVKRSTIFSVIVILITAAYTLAAFLLSWLAFGGVYTFKSQIITGLIVSLLVAIGFRPLYDWIRKTTDTFLFKGEYRPQELITNISNVLSRTLDLNTVINTLKGQISQALRIERMNIVILGEDNMPRQEYQSTRLRRQEEKEALKKIIAYFKNKKEKEVVVLEEIKRKKAEKATSEKSFVLIKKMEKLEIALVVPLFLKEKLVGLFLLSSKKSGDMFTNEDIKTLEGIASQSAIAIENARLYEEAKNFNIKLKKEVDKATKNLREANERLKKLDEAKTDFISIASHQLRTPLTIIKGYLSMILENNFGKVSKKQKEAIDKVFVSSERLIDLVEDLLNISRIESGRMEYNFKKIDLQKIIQEVCNELRPEAKEKNLRFIFSKPKKYIPKINIDSEKIRQVLMNLIDNAIKYTSKGNVTISLERKRKEIEVSVKDTGMGFNSGEKSNLFQKFSRNKKTDVINTEGTGLGLYIAKQIVNSHSGKIWAESKGRGKGSEFCFKLPIGKNVKT